MASKLRSAPVGRLSEDRQVNLKHSFELAELALQHYALGATHLTFIQHNAGIVFHVEAPAMAGHTC